MTVVYVLMEYRFEVADIVGVFFTREAAEKRAASKRAEFGAYDYQVVEHEMEKRYNDDL